ncbi:hypothetical protein ACTXT7_016460 [Hymenolepis weldensis]
MALFALPWTSTTRNVVLILSFEMTKYGTRMLRRFSFLTEIALLQRQKNTFVKIKLSKQNFFDPEILNLYVK